MFGMLDISTSALAAQRTRLDAIAANLANADVKVDPKSPDAFSERVVEFASGDPASGQPLPCTDGCAASPMTSDRAVSPAPHPAAACGPGLVKIRGSDS